MNLSFAANVATIISSFTIIYALCVYIKDKLEKNKRFNFSVISKRRMYFSILAKKPSLIDKVVVEKDYKKGSKISEILLSRYMLSANGDREEILRNGLRFILSDEAIRAFINLDSAISDNLDEVLSRFCYLAIDGEQFYTSSTKGVEASINLEKINSFVVKFPIPEDLYDEDIFSDIRFGRKSIASLGSKVIQNYFLPYLILYVAKNYDSFSKDDSYRVFSVLWEVGPS